MIFYQSRHWNIGKLLSPFHTNYSYEINYSIYSYPSLTPPPQYKENQRGTNSYLCKHRRDGKIVQSFLIQHPLEERTVCSDWIDKWKLPRTPQNSCREDRQPNFHEAASKGPWHEAQKYLEFFLGAFSCCKHWKTDSRQRHSSSVHLSGDSRCLSTLCHTRLFSPPQQLKSFIQTSIQLHYHHGL